MEEKNKKSGLAVAGLVLGIISIVLCLIPVINLLCYVLGILAFIFGIIPLIQKKRKVMASFALVLGILSLIITYQINAAAAAAVVAGGEALNEELDKLSDGLDSSSEENLSKFDVELGAPTDGVLGVAEVSYKVTNATTDTLSGMITLEATDADGNQIDTATIYVNSLDGGKSTEDTTLFSKSASDLEGTTIKVKEVTAY